jgi:hypothetical protein
MLERDIENAAGAQLKKWAASRGLLLVYLKLSILGSWGWPDRLILWEGGGISFIEFKRPGGKPTPKQLATHELIRKLGFRVEIHDNVESAVRFIQEAVGATSRATPRS